MTLAGQVGVVGPHHDRQGRRSRRRRPGFPNSVDAWLVHLRDIRRSSNRDWLKSSAVFRKLPELRKAIADLDARLAELEARLEVTGPALSMP